MADRLKVKSGRPPVGLLRKGERIMKKGVRKDVAKRKIAKPATTGYQDKLNKVDRGSPFDNDPGDEPDLTVEEEFELFRDIGMKLDDFVTDPEKGKRYVEWLKTHPAE